MVELGFGVVGVVCNDEVKRNNARIQREKQSLRAYYVFGSFVFSNTENDYIRT